jgi:hypothetical protein
MKKILVIVIITFHAVMLCSCSSQDFGSEMFSLSKIRNNVKSKRISSFNKTGGNQDRLQDIADGAKVTLMDVKGAGAINHIWITMPPDSISTPNDIILRMFWDGNSFPSVESPLGPFFGNGWNESYDFNSVPLSVTPVKSYVCYFSMPFSNGARIEIENQTGSEIRRLYYYVDYYEMDQLPKNSGRFHAWFNHELTEANSDSAGMGKNINGKNNYLFANITGKGQFIGVNYYVNAPTPGWYGEGDDMIFIDGDTLPTLNGTGTEDFFNTSYCPEELVQHPYFGYPRVNNAQGHLGRTHIYRFFITDPVYFDKSCKFTIEHGTNNNLALDLASVAYWYQDKASGLSRSFTKEERQPKPIIEASQIKIWRNIWRVENGQ